MRKLFSWILLCGLIITMLSGIASAQENYFSDVRENHWAKTYIDKLTGNGVIPKGGEFKPDDSITRRNFSAYLSRALNLPHSNLNFSDVSPNSEFASDISAASGAGLISGTGNGKFSPENKITRQDTAVICARAIEYNGLDQNKNFYATQGYYRENLEIPLYARGAVGLMTRYGVMTGKPDYKFDPKGTVTKAEAAAIICRLMDAINAGNTNTLTTAPRKDDSNTVALWMFDDLPYKNSTITNAALTEDKNDLFLSDNGNIIDSGKFGRALMVNTAKGGYAVGFAGYVGSVTLYKMREYLDQMPTGLWGPTETPQKLVKTLTSETGTMEFWYNAASAPASDAVFFETGYGYSPGATLKYLASTNSFAFVDNFGGYALNFTGTPAIFDNQWHHVAITFNSSIGRLFVDGKKTSTANAAKIAKLSTPPAENPDGKRASDSRGFKVINTPDPDYSGRIGMRYNVSIGSSLSGANGMTAQFDEFCVSDMARYTSDFTVPSTFSVAYSKDRAPSKANKSLPLLFPAGFKTSAKPAALNLSSRKHVFIDTALVGTSSGMTITMNKPEQRPLKGITSPEGISVLNIDGKIYAYVYNGYANNRGNVNLFTSTDGINFQLLKTVMLNIPNSGEVFEDTNPNCPPSEKYKYTTWLANRGIYMYTSGDGISWRRAESAMLPLVSGGSAESFFDDQRGVYSTLIKRDSSYENPPEAEGTDSRESILFETDEPGKSWAFRPLYHKYFEGWTIPSVTGEGNHLFTGDDIKGVFYQVYRSREQKYMYAPDTYYAFLWKYDRNTKIRNVQLGVSRNGYDWDYFNNDWYFSQEEGGVMISNCMGRIGDELFQYGTFEAGHLMGANKPPVALVTKLDRFTSFNAAQTGTFTTKAFTFSGNNLVLNIKAKSAKVGFVDENGKEIPGFGLEDCNVISTDNTNYTVSWNGNSDLFALAGKEVKLTMSITEGSLYAIQFTKAVSK